MKKPISYFSTLVSLLTILIFSSIIMISCSNGESGKETKKIKTKESKKTSVSSKKSQSLFFTGEADFRISPFGGAIEVVDPQNPLYGAGITYADHTYRDKYTVKGKKKDANSLYILKQWAGGSVEDDTEGNPRILVPSNQDSSFNKSRAIASSVIVIYLDTDGDGSPDSFPAFLIKDDTNGKYTTYADLPEEGTITLVQLLELPELTISIPTRLKFLKIPEKVKGASGTVVGVGFPVAFSITDDLNAGLTEVGGKSPRKFKKNVTIKIPYSKDAVSALGINTNKLRLYDLHGNSWKNITKGLSVDTDNGLVSAKVKKFSIFQVVAPVSSINSNNSLPLIVSVGIKEKSKKIVVKYNLQDAEGDPSDIKAEYKQAGDSSDDGWKGIKSGTKKNLKPGKKTFSWKFASDIGDNSGYFQIRITPSQKIAGKNVNGGTNYSETFRINSPGASKISPPKNLAGTVDNDKTPPQVSLTWNASTSSGVTGYNVYRQARFDTGFEKTFKVVGSSTSTSFTDDTLISTFYEAIYKLTAFDSSGSESSFSDDIKLASKVLGGYGYGGYGYGS